MYAVIEKNRLEISVAEFYNMAWYDKNGFLSKTEEYNKETTFIRQGDMAYDFKARRRWKIRLGEKRKKASTKKRRQRD